ncbi:DUF2490 domain-containing protein [Flavobacterium sp. LMO8]|uniref:DUF2490 domain-containing protein n=1 Tax=Flavobacterium sp. LMO8 TaxID=2654244 RepID=UPI001292BAFA|nr:DUF2490 domain-containing protein [Flavobacterium sp. LMO8]MQP24616.1 DUF2490 domain-containing protein [Flavobacterium sp. LMO8]
MKHLEILLLESFLKIKNHLKVALVLSVLLFQNSYGQKKIQHQKLIWYGYYNTLQLSPNWKLHSEIQERHFINPVAQHQLVFRANIERRLVNNWSTLIGMTLFLQSPQNPNSKSNLMVPELRPSVGFVNFESFGLLKMNHKYQLEVRFFHNQVNGELTSGYAFSNFRFRYQLGFDYPLLRVDESDKIILKIKDEVMLNIGNQIVKNTFDQNRIYLGLNYVVTPNLAFEVGYMNWFQQQKSGTDYYDRNIIRFSIFHFIS